MHLSIRSAILGIFYPKINFVENALLEASIWFIDRILLYKAYCDELGQVYITSTVNS